MPRNGSGSYTLPGSNSWNPAVTDTTIDPTDWNAVADDFETAFSDSIARDGQTTTTAVIPFASGLSSDTIAENSANAGVTIDGVLMKDSTIIWEGATADDFETTLTVTDPTADRTITLPNLTGTVMLNLVEDTTPQLGGDLDLNSNNIDFPTTANVSDCLDEDDMASDSATVLVTQQSAKAYVDNAVRGNIWGLTLSNGTDTDHDIDIAAGQARDGGNAVNIVLSAITKQIDAVWAVGTDQGGLDTGTVAADTWYHMWAIRRSDTGVSDALFSTSATSPTMPTNYDQKRRIGAVLTDSSSNILGFSQNGDEFMWDDPPSDYSVASPGTSAITTTLSVPTGVVVWARANFYQSTGSVIYVSPLDVDDEAPSSNTPPLGQGSDGSGEFSFNYEVRTNTSAQIRHRQSSGTANLNIATLGWVDRRGRDN